MYQNMDDMLHVLVATKVLHGKIRIRTYSIFFKYQQQMSDSVYIQFVKNCEIVKRNKIPAFPRRRVLSSLLFRVEHVLARDYYIYRCH